MKLMLPLLMLILMGCSSARWAPYYPETSQEQHLRAGMRLAHSDPWVKEWIRTDGQLADHLECRDCRIWLTPPENDVVLIEIVRALDPVAVEELALSVGGEMLKERDWTRSRLATRYQAEVARRGHRTTLLSSEAARRLEEQAMPSLQVDTHRAGFDMALAEIDGAGRLLSLLTRTLDYSLAPPEGPQAIDRRRHAQERIRLWSGAGPALLLGSRGDALLQEAVIR